MSNVTEPDIDYEHLDDLPLDQHFEWRYLDDEKTQQSKPQDDDCMEWEAA